MGIILRHANCNHTSLQQNSTSSTAVSGILDRSAHVEIIYYDQSRGECKHLLSSDKGFQGHIHISILVQSLIRLNTFCTCTCSFFAAFVAITLIQIINMLQQTTHFLTWRQILKAFYY